MGNLNLGLQQPSVYELGPLQDYLSKNNVSPNEYDPLKFYNSNQDYYPWHPTFSDESMYYKKGMPAVHWTGKGNENIPAGMELPDWDRYTDRAQKYISNKFKNSPITGEMLSNAAKNTFQRTGKYIPPELALSQAQFETQMGTVKPTKKRSQPVQNPFNVGEYDKKTVWRSPDTQTGIQRYMDLIANYYLQNKSVGDLLKNFVNSKNKRYASDINYEKKIGGQVDYISRNY